MNKRILDLLTGITGVFTTLAAIPYEKETMAILPPSWTPWLIKIGLVNILLLRVLAFFAPPTPSAVPEKKEGDSGKVASLQIFLIFACLSLSACSSWTPEQRAVAARVFHAAAETAIAYETGADGKTMIKIIDKSF